MHIKEAYQRRLKQQSSPPRSQSQKIDHSSTIGSIHTGQLHYSNNQPFFVDYKVRDTVKQAKQYIKTHIKDADVLDLKDKKWNGSVSAPRKFSDFQKQESHKMKMLKIKLGFSDFSPVKDKPNKIFQGTETRNNYTGWNVSTYFDKKQKQTGAQYTNLSALDNTIKYNKSKLSNYKSLDQRFDETRQKQKSQLLNSSDILEDFKNSFVFSNPNASPQKTYANVHKMFQQNRRQKLKLSIMSQNQTQQSFTTAFKAKLSPTQKLKIKYVHFHTGNWQKPLKSSQKQQTKIKNDSEDQNEDEGYSWSCCLNSDKNSKGCSYKVQDGNKMNLVGFQHA